MIKIMLFLKKKPGMSPQDFMDYYEKHHAPLSVRHIPGLLEYKRSFINRGAAPFGREPQDVDFDVVTELVFATEADYERAIETIKDPEIGKLFAEDEKQLFDRMDLQRRFFVTECRSTIGGAHQG